ncbi:50S ribosomal protein L15 [Ichthyobacterium seriolicida]|uniref:Large ribosomal subunit protein uL15 n=1 Tax=Ichthyobacterium seriolicida TaxID=242600 RepID=A0A1J1EA71_9FLAO|nr:50S ribosomal protein L15 [Ichthyobacterium seriolicida]BAV94827.1 50S ribosomal protein L15 [Ichthyobacterium seriolicida]
MDLSTLKPAEGSVKNNKRIARGEGSGRGGTSTRGHKGAKSRSGFSKKIGFEGGQMPLQRRVPKFGFSNINRKEYRGVNLDVLQSLVDSKKIKDEVTPDILVSNGIASNRELIKILARGELKSPLKVSVHKFSAKAKQAIISSGGQAKEL